MNPNAEQAHLLSVGDAAERLAVSPWSIRAWVKRGDIRTVRLGRRVLIPASEIARITLRGLPSLKQAA